MKKNLLLLSVLLVLPCWAWANALVISSVQRLDAPNRDQVQFTISWQNSWLVGGTPSNHDAVWVFVKYNPCDGGQDQFSHALLSTTMTDHTFSGGVAAARPILETNRFGTGTGHNTGVLVRRRNPGIGNIVEETVTLRIVGGTDGTDFDTDTEYNVEVFGIEMVQIPAGGFTVGANSLSSYCNKHYTELSISDESAAYTLTINTTWTSPTTAPLHQDFPKGVDELYIMKYEISQGQYCDFVNNIGSQNSARLNGTYGVNRYVITSGSVGFVADDPNRACNFLSMNDALAYLDWAALRPMSELEYEKVAKIGPPGGYAFGATTYSEALTVTTPEDGTELVNTGANLHVLGTQANLESPGGDDLGGGPLGVGIFARTGGGGRAEAGASFHGVMELSGNLWEPTVNAWVCASAVSNCASTSGYTGIWGDGMLTAGFADNADWPTVNDANYGWRGGSWNDPEQVARTGDRSGNGRSGINTTSGSCNTGLMTISSNLATGISLAARSTTGGRGVR